MIGQTLGHYRIPSKLGEGGMGVVYSARDAHLDRRVAIKVLPAEAVANPERKRRFVQEAKAASALSHPNIITIYDISQAGGVDFIAMEYVSGKTLEDLIKPKGLALGEALKYAVQIADALASAHAAGIVHRDLKPANIMVNEQGLVKVLDFGLAKLTEPKESDELAPTLTKIDESPQTEMGAVLGTVAYMSPEQAEGRPVDARSDIFSFGSVLYEMTTGRRAFGGNTKLSILTAIVRDEPERASAVAPVVPLELESLIARLLRKDPDRRWQSMADVKVALTEIKEGTSTGGRIASTAPADSVPGSFLKRRKALAATIIGALLLVSAAWFFLDRFFQPQKPDFGESASVLISKFDNRTGDPVFDGTLEYALERELSNSSFVSVAPRERIEDALRLMKRPLNASIDANLGREICLRDGGIRVLLGGRIEKLGSTYSLSVLLVDPAGGATIASVNDEAPGQQQVLAATRRLSNNVRAALGEALPAIRESDEKLEKVTTPSLRALQLYTEAMALINERKWGPAAELLKAAISADPGFASANIYCAWALRNQGSPPEQWLPYRERALQLAEASSDVERYFILGSYYSIRGQDEQAIAP
ncbi:MAG: protein kinase domain-containing protein [Acidobacteriota bacterium]